VLTSTLTAGSPSDHVFTYYDALGWKLFSNEANGVWTRYFYDGAGRPSKEVRFRYQDPQTGQFLAGIVDRARGPRFAQLSANYAAAVAGHDPAHGRDYIRVLECSYDAAGNKIAQTAVSDSYGAVTNEWRYDRFNNKTREVIGKGSVDAAAIRARFAPATPTTASTAPRRFTAGPFQYFDSQGIGYFGSASAAVAYDRFGNKSTETDELGNVKRFHYNAQGWLDEEWMPPAPQTPAAAACAPSISTTPSGACSRSAKSI